MKLNVATAQSVFRCDCVAMKKERQAEIYRETEGMTRAEIREYYRKGSEEFWEGVDRRRAELASESQS